MFSGQSGRKVPGNLPLSVTRLTTGFILNYLKALCQIHGLYTAGFLEHCSGLRVGKICKDAILVYGKGYSGVCLKVDGYEWNIIHHRR